MTARPTVSVIMANHDGAAHLAAALRSVLSQSLSNLELILSDDASSDGSLAIAEKIGSDDPRLRILTSPVRSGPGAARNRALDAARGEWIAVVDSDDLLHPDRFAILVAEADRLSADAIADDLIHFGAGVTGGTLLPEGFATGPVTITPGLFLRSELPGPGHAPLGYLKPMIRRDRIGGLRYDTWLRIGEDHDFFLRLLLAGIRATLLPQGYYLYRRRAGSTSHRLRAEDAGAMLAAQDRLAAAISTPELRPLFARRRANLIREQRFATLIGAIRTRSVSTALATLLRDPRLAAKLARAGREHLAGRKQSGIGLPTGGPARIVLAPDGTRAADWLPDARPLGFDGSEPTIVVPESPAAWRPRDWAAFIADIKDDPLIHAHGAAGRFAAGYLPTWQRAGDELRRTGLSASPEDQKGRHDDRRPCPARPDLHSDLSPRH